MIEARQFRPYSRLPPPQKPLSPTRTSPNVGVAGIGLCLSGGGFRATLFHLGALRRLNELGVLHRVRTISSVSVGSLMALVLADAIRKLGGALTGPFPDFDKQVAKPTDDLTSSNFRGRLLRRRLNPINFLRGREIVDHMGTLLKKDTSKLKLRELPSAPPSCSARPRAPPDRACAPSSP